jgi:hypothetical protein
LSLDQYRGQLLVWGSVARNVRDLIKSLAYARVPDHPLVIWNGIDSREIYCPVRCDAGVSGCPARNTTLPNVPRVTSSSNPPHPSTATGMSTTSSSYPLSSSTSITTDSSTTSYDGSSSSFIETITIVSWQVGVASVVAINTPQASSLAITALACCNNYIPHTQHN